MEVVELLDLVEIGFDILKGRVNFKKGYVWEANGLRVYVYASRNLQMLARFQYRDPIANLPTYILLRVASSLPRNREMCANIHGWPTSVVGESCDSFRAKKKWFGGPGFVSNN